MALHTDIPTRAQIGRLLAARDPESVSIYLPTAPVGEGGQADRIAFRNLADAALGQLREADADGRSVSAIEEALWELHDDEGFWELVANSLAVFVTPTSLRSFRLPNELTAAVEVSDRFHVLPLLRAVTFPQSAFVLALAQGSVALYEVTADLPTFPVHVPDLPADVASAAGKASIKDRAPSRALQGSEGQKVRMRQYARKVDQALRPLLGGSTLPLILAATEPLSSIFREVNSYPHLAAETIAGNPEERTPLQLGEASRPILDQLYGAELEELRGRFEAFGSRGRAAAELGDVARAATFGAVETLFADIDAELPGSLDSETGAITPGPDDAHDYGILDEVARRVIAADGRVLAVRAGEVPGDGPAAAILRYPA
ncbi:MAG: hypothetical protein JST31_03895 [Actinobacteria bacterium]|nr:hypothetical protein [Actinomycetota bacterium]